MDIQDIHAIFKRIPEKVLMVMALMAMILIPLGSGGFLYAASISSGVSEPYKISQELGLSDASGIAVHDKGVLFCGSHGYTRIHAYDLSGKFLYALRIPAGGGTFKLRIEKGLLRVATARTDKIITFDVDGNVVSIINDPNSYEDFGNEEEYYTKDSKGNVFYIKSPRLYPTILKRSDDGRTIKIVSPKLLQWIVTGPLPAWYFGTTGILLMMIILWAKGIFPIQTNDKDNFGRGK